MHRLVGTALLLSAVGPIAAVAEQSGPALDCKIGPVTKRYADADWLVYSCDDQRTIVFITPEGSPAFPFYFMMTPGTGAYRLTGEGTGDKRITDAAYQKLSSFTDAQRAALINETRAAHH